MKLAASIKKNLLLFLLIAFAFSCEKDDICVENVTPKLIIRFYDANDPTQVKAVSSLTVTTGDNTLISQQSTDSIAIPLDVNNLETVYTLTSDTTDDIVTITYGIDEVYVSRSCGFIANYNQLNLMETGNWIQQVEIISQTIENENQAHVQIRH